MVSFMRHILSAGLPQWLAALGYFCAAQQAVCMPTDDWQIKEIVSNILDQSKLGDPSLVIESFDKVAGIVESSENPLEKGREFLQVFVEEINTRYGMNVTIADASSLVYENMKNLSVPQDVEDIALRAIRDLSADEKIEPHGSICPMQLNTYPPQHSSGPAPKDAE